MHLNSSGATTLLSSGAITVDPGASYSYDHWTTRSSSGWLIKKTTVTEHLRESTTVQASQIHAGEVRIRAKGDITLTAADIQSSSGATTVLAGGDIHYLAAHNQSLAQDSSKTSKSLFGFINVGSSSSSHRAQGSIALVSSVQAQGDVLSHSDGNTLLAAARVKLLVASFMRPTAEYRCNPNAP